MNVFQFALYVGGFIACALAVMAVIPNPFRQGIRDTFSIIFGGLLKSSTTNLQRAELRVKQLSAQIDNDKRKSSDLRGTLNNEKNHLSQRQEELKAAEADYELAKEQKLGEQAEADCLDKIGAAEEAVSSQQSVVNDIQSSVDATRLAVAKAAGELKKLQNVVKTKAGRDVATKAISSAADVLKTSKDIAQTTSQIGHDLDKIDEEYEQAKARFEDAQGSETERKLEEARQKKQREDIRKRMEERNGKKS